MDICARPIDSKRYVLYNSTHQKKKKLTEKTYVALHSKRVT